MEKTLTELTAEYYDLIGGEHHKDKDCHFYIEKIYSYGREPYWQFCHYGYCWSIDNFFEDKWSHLRTLSRFYEKQAVGDVFEFAPVSKLITSNTELYVKLQDKKFKLYND